MGETVQAAWKVEKKSYCNDPGRNVIAYLKIRGEQFEDVEGFPLIYGML